VGVFRKKQPIGNGHQRGTLTAQVNIRLPKIAHHRARESACHFGGVAQLVGEAPVRLVVNGVSVVANNVRLGQVFFPNKLMNLGVAPLGIPNGQGP
jgi:hypothetical protein